VPLQILLIEDNLGDVRLTKEAIRETGASFDLHVVSDGVEAIAFLSREGTTVNAPRPDLILLDLNLPTMHGRVVLAHIKRNDNLKAIPTVTITTSNSESDVTSSYDLHANCYLRKPHQWCEFRDLLKSVFALWLNAASLPPLNETHREGSTPKCLPCISAGADDRS
jgi:two-component system, chemotaxis family, response regulator Rcp1